MQFKELFGPRINADERNERLSAFICG